MLRASLVDMFLSLVRTPYSNTCRMVYLRCCEGGFAVETMDLPCILWSMRPIGFSGAAPAHTPVVSLASFSEIGMKSLHATYVDAIT